MKASNMLKIAAVGVAVAATFGCGSKNREGSTNTDSYASSQACIGCHSGYVDGNGVNIVSQWTASKHNTGNGAGCADCHTTNGHPDGGVMPNIPGDETCLKCHTQASMKTGAQHFAGAYSLDPTKAAYVTPYDSNTCRTCHNPHDMTTLMSVNKQWAEGGHGDITKDPWMHYNWRTASRDACQRCHTAGGFRHMMTTGNLPTSAIFGKYTTGREALGCKGCHTDYSFKRIAPKNAFVTPFTPGLGTTAFPSNVGDSALCIPCHTGTNGGGAIETTTANLANTNFSAFNSHYMAAAGMMYVKSGFTGFIDPATVIGTSTYGKSLTSNDDGGAVSSTHRKLGTSAIIGDHGITANDGVDQGGPCVVCHMKGGHSFEVNGTAFDRVCAKCHSSEGSTALTAENFEKVFLEPQGEAYQETLNLALTILKNKYGIGYNGAAYPYFYDLTLDPTGKTALKDWTRGGTVAEPKKLLGACFNVNLLKREPGAYAHARTYTRRLLYDSIDFLDDMTINRSVGATAVATDPTHFSKGTTAYADGTLTSLAAGTSEGMVYINGWSRTTGAWNTIERP